MFCYSCGFQLPAGARFCVGCGAQVLYPGTQASVVIAPAPSHAVHVQPTGIAHCPRCGGRNPNDNLFCTNCGASLQPSLSVARQPADGSGFGLDGSSPQAGQTAISAPSAHTPEQAVGGRPKIGGWLWLFCLGLIVVTPLMSLSEIGRSLDQPLLIVLEVGLVAFSIYTGIAVERIRPNALRLVKIYFVVMLVLGFLCILGSFASDLGETGQRSPLEGTLAIGLRTVVGVAIWGSYFRKSTRVRATFGSNL